MANGTGSAQSGHWFSDKGIACEAIFRTLVCLPCTWISARHTYPSDWWFKSKKVANLKIPTASKNYSGPEKRLSVDTVKKQIVKVGGVTEGACVSFGCGDRTYIFNNVLKVDILEDGTVVMEVLPEAEQHVIDALLNELTTPVGKRIPVQMKQPNEPTAV